MTNRVARTGRRAQDQLTLVLIAIVVVRLALIVPRWVTGTPPAYPMQYEGRLLFTIAVVGILSASLLSKRALLNNARGKAAYWMLLGAAITALVIDAVIRP